MAEGQEAEIALTTYAGLKEVPESFFVREKFLYSKTPWWGGATVTNIDVYYSRMSDEILQHSNLRPLAGYGDYVGGFVQSLEKNYTAAIAYFDRAIRLGEYWRYFERRGWAHYRSGDLDAAIADYDRGIALRPQEPDLLSQRGWVHYRAGRPEDALEDMTRALELLPLDCGIHTNRAIVLNSLKRYEEAIEDLDVAAVYGSHNASG